MSKGVEVKWTHNPQPAWVEVRSRCGICEKITDRRTVAVGAEYSIKTKHPCRWWTRSERIARFLRERFHFPHASYFIDMRRALGARETQEW